MVKSDQQIEQDMIKVVIEEALDPDQQEYLLEALESDGMLADIFDAVMSYATEFSGDGLVDVPGETTGTDPVPSRLEEGEFVFTAKAVSVLGADYLQQLMEQAEAQADQQGPQATQQIVGPVQ
jgi:hypothetical protein